MARYLIVAHQTVSSAELQSQVAELVTEDPAAEFAILVPELPAPNFTWEGETVDVAKQRAEATKAQLEDTTGARVIRAVAGTSDALQAISDELAGQPAYDTLIVCTLPPGISRWLRLDLVRQAQRKFDLRVIHVVAHPTG